jgi:hypothetical protein
MSKSHKNKEIIFICDEYKIFKELLLENYNVEVDDPQIEKLCKNCLNIIASLNIWKAHLDDSDDVISESLEYYDEIISNLIHVAILFVMRLKVPAVMMLRRSRENLLNFIYYSEHRVEFYKKEYDDNRKNFNGFKDLKDYLVQYPFNVKYNISNQIVSNLVKDSLLDWSEQYKRLSHFVHGSNTKYMENVKNFDGIITESKELEFMIKELDIFLEVLNTLFVVFYFNEYRNLDEHDEKPFIRNSFFSTKDYKRRLKDMFKEI